MIHSQTESYIDDYLGSERMLFLDPAIKEHADGVLRAFFEEAAKRGADSLESLTAKTVEVVLFQHLGRLAVSAEAKRAAPDLLEGFFGYLRETGRYPGADAWQICVEALGGRFRDSIRGDGSVKGETFRKNYSAVGRNDPCPCGSGKKFKKCCGPLIGI